MFMYQHQGYQAVTFTKSLLAYSMDEQLSRQAADFGRLLAWNPARCELKATEEH